MNLEEVLGQTEFAIEKMVEEITNIYMNKNKEA